LSDGVVGRSLHRHSEAVLRGLKVPFLVEALAQSAKQVGAGRIFLHQLVEQVGRRNVIAALHLQHRQQIQELNIRRVQPHGFPHCRFRLFLPPQALQDDAKVRMRRGIVRGQRGRPLEGFSRGLEVIHLEANEPSGQLDVRRFRLPTRRLIQDRASLGVASLLEQLVGVGNQVFQSWFGSSHQVGCVRTTVE